MVSIITPSFRQLDWLRLAIASVADQEGVITEHIVQDAGTEGMTEFVRQNDAANNTVSRRHMATSAPT
jgi:GT2 family glycosyltransferase